MLIAQVTINLPGLQRDGNDNAHRVADDERRGLVPAVDAGQESPRDLQRLHVPVAGLVEAADRFSVKTTSGEEGFDYLSGLHFGAPVNAARRQTFPRADQQNRGAGKEVDKFEESAGKGGGFGQK